MSPPTETQYKEFRQRLILSYSLAMYPKGDVAVQYYNKLASRTEYFNATSLPGDIAAKEVRLGIYAFKKFLYELPHRKPIHKTHASFLS
jgi:hypothetical protein